MLTSCSTAKGMGVVLSNSAEIRLTATRPPDNQGAATPAEPVVCVVDVSQFEIRRERANTDE